MFSMGCSMPDDIIILSGPTGIGKTDLSLELVERWNAEIISADSRLVYRGLDIGTAKPSASELAAAPHHLIDVRDPGERFTVADFRDGCLKAIDEIRGRGRTPIIAGGTCMYLHALLHGFDFGGADRDPDLRAELERRAREDGPEPLHAELARVDADAAGRIPVGDVRRVVRALELFHLTGRATARMKDESPAQCPLPGRLLIFLLWLERDYLYDRINKRAERLYNNGIVEETEKILRSNGPGIREFLRGIIGYGQAIDFLDGRFDKQGAVDATAMETRRFAKRQMTWFRRMRSAIWLGMDDTRRAGLAPLIEHYRKKQYY